MGKPTGFKDYARKSMDEYVDVYDDVDPRDQYNAGGDSYGKAARDQIIVENGSMARLVFCRRFIDISSKMWTWALHVILNQRLTCLGETTGSIL